MEDYFPSEESDTDPEYFNDVNDQKKYLKKLQAECINYENVIKDLEAEKKERDEILQRTQAEIEDLQRDILYHDLNIEKATNVYAELNNLNQDKINTDKIEKQNELEMLNIDITKNLTKYINRVMYTKKVEFEEKLEKKKNQFQAVCIKFYREDPTDEDYGPQHAQSYSFQVFGLSNDLTFEQLLMLAKEHWGIKNIQDYVLTDQDHHDLVLLKPVPIVQYLTHENTGYALFVLRPKNTKMKELVASQKVGIMLVQETEKQGKLKEEFKKIFALLRKAKPGIKTYEMSYEENEQQGSPADGTILNFLMLISILILMILSLTNGGIQPADAREYNAFTANYTGPTFYSSQQDFLADMIYLLYDFNQTSNRPINLHYVPIGVRRVIMNKMQPDACTKYNDLTFCTYADVLTDSNLDTSPLTNTTAGPWMNYQKVSEENELNLDGQASSFDGSGFFYDFHIDIKKAEAEDIVNNVLKRGGAGNYFGVEARAFIFASLYFEPNRHIILERNVIFEVMSSGIVQITDKKTYLKPATGDSNSTAHKNIDLALLIITIVGYFFNIVYNVYKIKKAKELIAARNLVKYVIIALVIAYFAVYHDKPSKSLEDIINSTTYQTLAKYGQQRQDALTYLIVAFFLQSLTIIRSFVFSRTVNVFLNIFAQSYKDFLSFLLLFFSAFIGFSFVWWIAFGPYSMNLETLISTAFEVFLYFATGNTMIVSSFFGVNETWAVLLVIVTCFIVFIQLDALMMSLIQENVRQLYLKSKPQSTQTPLKIFLEKVKVKALAFKARVMRLVGDPRRRRR